MSRQNVFETAVRAAFPDAADQVLAIVRGTREHALTFEAAQRRDRESYNPHDTATLKLEALNQVLAGCGVEGFCDGVGNHGVEYVNFGDTYATTILYLAERCTWRVGSYGDVIEAAPEGRYQ